jgi:uncharacterized protein (DUF1015 family)
MATVKPFICYRPKESIAYRVAALPYDVYNRREAKLEILREPSSFLKVDRPEVSFPDDVDTYDSVVYDRANEFLQEMISDGTLISDGKECYYVYELIMEGRSQTGVVACASVEDYLNHVIKKHENTREDKEIDRFNHVDICNAHTGPIFMAYRSHQLINEIIFDAKQQMPIYHFQSMDGITHNVWVISQERSIMNLYHAFREIDRIYIADGHHRAASAVKLAQKRREEAVNYTGEEEYNFFLSVLFPQDQLMIMPYNRTVKDLNGLSKEEFLYKVGENFIIKELGVLAFSPTRKASFGMYLGGSWYELEAKASNIGTKDPVASLDVSILQNYLLDPILDIKDSRTDKRIDFVGGVRGLGELEKRVTENDAMVAFSMYPTSLNELFEVSDAGKLMPPKSTWFEPKLRSGLFVHKF